MSSNDTDGKTKIFRNPDRNKSVDNKSYIPQYQVRGIEPSQYNGSALPTNTVVASPSTINPREGKRPALRQPYAISGLSPLGRGPAPNVGNNMEHTWSSGVDDEIVDDLSGEVVDPTAQMIDNNDFATEQALGYQGGLNAADLQPLNQGVITIEENEQPPVLIKGNSSSNEDLFVIVQDLADDAFLLIVSGIPICSGPKEEIQEQASSFVFGEHEMCDGNPVPIEEIVILKKIKVKVGLYLE